MSPRVLLSCGEPSGDLYAGALVRELRTLSPGVEVTGLGGPESAAAGAALIQDYRTLGAVTGLTEVVRAIPRSYAALNRLVASARAQRPDVLVVIDWPEINFRLARQIKRLGVPVVYYITPQIWAWRAGRLKTIRQIADKVLVIFPFEEAIYRDGGVPVEFVGHPLLDLMKPPVPRATFLSRIGLAPDAPTVAFLPGSRVNEVARILPALVDATTEIRRAIPGVQFVVARAPGLDDGLFESIRQRCAEGLAIVEGDTDSVLASADAAVTASGTATVQTALHDVPMVVVYRLSPLTYRLVKPLVTVRMVGMVNLIAGGREPIMPELIQDAFTPEAVAREVISILTDRDRAAAMRAGLARVRASLGGLGASARAARAILEMARPNASRA